MKDTPGDLIHKVSHTLRKLHLFMRVTGARAAAESGLHFGQLPVLEYIERHDGCTQRDLVQWLNVSPPSVATSVKRMHRAGLIEKNEDENDLRVTRLSITETGLTYAQCCRKEFDRLDNRMLEGFSEAELENMMAMLLRMIDNLGAGEISSQELLRMLQAEMRREKERKSE